MAGDGFWNPGPASAGASELDDLDDLWVQPTEPSLPAEGDLWLDTFENVWKYRTGGEWVPVDDQSATTTDTLVDLVPIGLGIAGVTVTAGSTVEVEIDTPFGLDSDGAGYYDAAGAAAGEEAILVFDRTTGTYSLVPLLRSDPVDPVLPDPDYVTRTLLTTPTYDGSGQTVHPDIVKIRGGWNGWLYWMAITPYPAANDALENPSILVSNDGITWQVPAGLTNPVVAAPPVTEYHSDPDLVYANGTLYLFFRRGDHALTYDRIFLTTSTDGVTWTDPVLVLAAGDGELVSSTVEHDAGTWRMWSVDMTISPNAVKLRTATDPQGPWSAATTCSAPVGAGRDVWHLDVIRDGPVWRAIVNTTALDVSGAPTGGRITVGTSTDGETWSIVAAEPLVASGSGWDGASLYRGTALFEQDRWRLWFGGVSAANEWRTGYTEIDPNDFP